MLVPLKMKKVQAAKECGQTSEMEEKQENLSSLRASGRDTALLTISF